MFLNFSTDLLSFIYNALVSSLIIEKSFLSNLKETFVMMILVCQFSVNI
jgi:hypothetical protein